MTRRKVYNAREILRFYADKWQVKTSDIMREMGAQVRHYLYVMHDLGLLDDFYNGFYRITPLGLSVLSKLEDDVKFAVLAEAQRH